jgi:hypothetical protein
MRPRHLLGKVFGPGCPACVPSTGPELARELCAVRGSIDGRIVDAREPAAVLAGAA